MANKILYRGFYIRDDEDGRSWEISKLNKSVIGMCTSYTAATIFVDNRLSK